MGAVIWKDGYSRPGIRKATDAEVDAQSERTNDSLRTAAQERFQVATEAALPDLVAYLEEHSPQTIAFYKREWRRNGPTHRKALHKAALAVSEKDGNIQVEKLKELFEQVLGYR